MESRSLLLNSKGFSLVELVVVLVMSMFIIGAVLFTSKSQEHNLSVQDRIVELQDNLRAGIAIMEKDLRMAGYDPECISPPCTGFITANSNSLSITMKDPLVSSTTNTISYALYDYQSDGDLDLGRDFNGSGLQPVIMNVEAFDLTYLDKNGNVLSSPLSTTDMAKIRVVEIAVVAHTEQKDPSITTSPAFVNLQGTQIFAPQHDGFRRQVVHSRVLCRNNF